MGASLCAAVIAATLAAHHPFDHDVWLVSYLFLVGFLAQGLLALAQAALAGRGPGLGPELQAALWSAGVIAVPLGVLGEARLAVVLGSAFLLAALAGFWRSAAGSPRASGWLRVGYLALVVFMAVSVVTGTALAWHTPWV